MAWVATLSVFSTGAMALTAYTAPGGNLAGQYCYDFDNYIRPTDSPVIGGYVPYGVASDRVPGGGDGSFWAYGVVCFNIPYGGVVDPYNNANLTRYPYYLGTAFYGDSRAPGLFWSGRFVSDSNNNWNWTPIVEATCPANSALIMAPGYVRGDGATPPTLNYYSSIGGGQLAQGNAATYTARAKLRHAVCVKTDTTQ